MQSEKKLSSREICSIIKSCRDSNVSKITFGDLCIEFNGTLVEEVFQPPVQELEPEKSDSSEDDLSTSDVAAYERELLAIEDPLAYEQQIIADYEEQNEGRGSE